MVQSRIHNMTSGLGRSCHGKLEFWGILQQIGTCSPAPILPTPILPTPILEKKLHFAYSHQCDVKVMSRQHPEVGSCQSDILCYDWLCLYQEL